MAADPLPVFARIEFHNLFQIAQWQDQIPWQPFQPGVVIHRLYGDGVTGPTAALIHFLEDCTIARHEHTGYEHILVLAGSQEDQVSSATPGSLMVNPPGSVHYVSGKAGCIVLAIYQNPVKFLSV